MGLEGKRIVAKDGSKTIEGIVLCVYLQHGSTGVMIREIESQEIEHLVITYITEVKD